MSRALTALLGALLGLGASAADAQVFHRTQVPGRPFCVLWPGREFLYRLDTAIGVRSPDGSEAAAIDAAVASWRAVSASCSDYVLRRDADIEAPLVGYKDKASDNANVITFRERDCGDVVPPEDPCVSSRTCGNTYACWNHGGGILALTTTTYRQSTGEILDADIELNASPGSRGFRFTTISSPPCGDARTSDCVATDVQNTMTHELGHVVGLDHVPELPGSTMEPSAFPGETQKRIIDEGSAAGFCEAYPRGLPPTQCGENPEASRRFVTESRGLMAGCSMASGAPGGAWALLVAWALGRRRGPHHRA